MLIFFHALVDPDSLFLFVYEWNSERRYGGKKCPCKPLKKLFTLPLRVLSYKRTIIKMIATCKECYWVLLFALHILKISRFPEE